MGYHYDEAGKKGKAAGARKKALEFNETMLKSPKYASQRKELLLISGAIHHYLGDDDLALLNMKKAIGLKYKNEEMDKEEEEALDKYLSGLPESSREDNLSNSGC